MIGVVNAAGVLAQRNGWLQLLLDRLVEVPESGKTAKDHLQLLKVCEKLIAHMMEMVLRIEEERGSKDEPNSDALRSLDERMAGTLHVLSLFCKAQPPLLLPHIGLVSTATFARTTMSLREG